MDTQRRVKDIKKLLNLAFGDHHDAKNQKDLKRMLNLVKQAREKIQALEKDLQKIIDDPSLVDELLSEIKHMPVPEISTEKDRLIIDNILAADHRPEKKPSLRRRIKDRSKKLFSSNKEEN